MHDKEFYDAFHVNFWIKIAGNDIDVYFEPLINNLKILWDEGIDEYDLYKEEVFNVKEVVL